MTVDRLRAFDAVVFDMDGVLLDSEPLHLAAINRVLSEEGHSLSHEDNLRFIGATVEFTWGELARMYSLRDAPERYRALYDDAVVSVLREAPLEPFPGVLHFIQAAREAGKPVGLATQSRPSWVAATLEGLGLLETFDAVVTADTVARGKPAPDLYLRACELLGAEPTRSLAIEDSLPGARSARSAGMTVIGIKNVYAGDALHAETDIVVERLDELLAPDAPWPGGRGEAEASRPRS